MSVDKKKNDDGYIAWGDIGAKPNQKKEAIKSDKPRPTYMKLEDGKKEQFRPIGKPYPFLSHFEIVRAISPGEEQDPLWAAGHVPKERYILAILDRGEKVIFEKDGEQHEVSALKYLEGGKMIFSKFKEFFEANNIDPGGSEGVDWHITLTVPIEEKNGKKFKNKRSSEYTVVNLIKPTPFTDIELEYIKATIIPPKTLKKPTDPELLKEMFEDAKKKGKDDPLPGSTEWWKARFARKAAEKNGDIGDGEPDEKPVSKSSKKSSKAEAVEEDNTDTLFDN